MILGTTIIYLIGFTWLKFAIDVSWAQALTLGVAPFLIGDAIKVLAAAALFPAVWAAVRAFTNR
jgi:biotin transport system substrate-specific component